MSMDDRESDDDPGHLDLRHTYDRIMADFGELGSDLPLAKTPSEMSDARTFLGEMGAAEEKEEAKSSDTHALTS